MASVYPNDLDSFTRRVQGETIQSAHINELQQAVESLEERLGTGVLAESLINLITVGEDPGHTHTISAIEAVHEGDVDRETPILARLAEDETVSGAWNYSDTLTLSKGADTTGLLISNANISLTSGKIGIGTSTPDQKLTLNSGLIFLNNSTLSTSPSGGSGMFIGAANSSGEIEGRVQVRSATVGSTLTFHTNSGGLNSAERLRITPDGYIGVDCTPLNAKLQFNATTGAAKRTVIWRYDADSNDLLFKFQRGTAGKLSGTGITSSTNISRIVSEGWSGGSDLEDYKVGAELRTVAAENWGSGALGTSFEFWSCAIGGSTLAKKFSILSSGNVELSGSSIQISTSSVPASNTATGTAGMISWGSDYLYVCVATNSWKRISLSSGNW